MHIMLRSGTGRVTARLCKTLVIRQYATAGASPKQTPISNLETNRFLPYPKLQDALRILRRRIDRPLTLSEKLLYTHLRNPLEQELDRGKSFLLLDPDRAACHDATATMAMLQFISAGLPRTMLPTSIHSDHLIVAENSAVADLANARDDYAEVSLECIGCWGRIAT
jgi:aconitate hydratase